MNPSPCFKRSVYKWAFHFHTYTEVEPSALARYSVILRQLLHASNGVASHIFDVSFGKEHSYFSFAVKKLSIQRLQLAPAVRMLIADDFWYIIKHILHVCFH